MNCIFEIVDGIVETVQDHGCIGLIIKPRVTYQRRWLEDGRRYEGEWDNLKRYPHGQGRMEYLSGETYDGLRRFSISII
ncbi:MAG: hypothetical protein HON43_05325 [Alphaproteobacteria bacterium]|nr:hypothetical protein [Alphaproteobacteria bacterium]